MAWLNELLILYANKINEKKWYTRTYKAKQSKIHADSRIFIDLYNRILNPLHRTETRKVQGGLLRHPTRTHIRSRGHDKRVPLCKECDRYQTQKTISSTHSHINNGGEGGGRHTPHNITSRKGEDEATSPDPKYTLQQISAFVPRNLARRIASRGMERGNAYV